MSRGVIFLNIGKKLLVRLAVAAHSLRRSYGRPATILCDQDSVEYCKRIGDDTGIDVQLIQPRADGKNEALLTKTCLHDYTPYDTSLLIDCDTITYDFPRELFALAEAHEVVFTQFADWTTTDNGIIRKRITQWAELYPQYVVDALRFGPAINIGVFSFTKNNSMMKDWRDIAEKGRRMFIPDETSCQLIVPQYPHKIVGSEYNASCKFMTKNDNTRIIHYHGRKHCRVEDGELVHQSNLWYEELAQLAHKEYVKECVQFDPQLRKHIRCEEVAWISRLLQE